MEELDSAVLGVPAPDSGWRTIWQFALTYNAYDRHGGFDGAARIAQEVRACVDAAGCFSADLATARAALFFEQRRYHHMDLDPCGDDEQYVRGLVAHIQELSGGTVNGPPDPLP